MTGEWQELGRAWLGNGVTDGPARVEGRVRWVDGDEATVTLAP